MAWKRKVEGEEELVVRGGGVGETHRRAGAGLACGLDTALEHVGRGADGGCHCAGDEAGQHVCLDVVL